MIQLVKNGDFRRFSVTIKRYVAGVEVVGGGFPITESILQAFGTYPMVTAEYLSSQNETVFTQRVDAFKSYLVEKYPFIVLGDFINQASGNDPLLCVPDIVESVSQIVIDQETNLLIYFDATGSMGSTYTSLDTMRRTIFKDRLLPFYNNNEAKYEEKVRLIDFGSERAFTAMNHMGLPIQGKTLIMLFQNEASGGTNQYHQVPFNNTFIGTAFPVDLAALKTRLDASSVNQYKIISYHIHGPGGWRPSSDAYKAFMMAVENGNNGFEHPTRNLTSYPQVKFVYDLEASQAASYYLDVIINTMRAFGYAI